MCCFLGCAGSYKITSYVELPQQLLEDTLIGQWSAVCKLLANQRLSSRFALHSILIILQLDRAKPRKQHMCGVNIVSTPILYIQTR